MDKNSLEIGRTSDNDIVIPDEHVSSRHATLTRTPDALIIQDLGSRNGTFVNGQQVIRKQVYVGDSVQFSKHCSLDWNHPSIVGLLSGGLQSGSGEKPFTIGRDPGNDMHLVHHGVDAFHAKLTRTPDGLLLEDLSSRDGTFVEGVKVNSVHIKKGMKVTLGRHCPLNWRDPGLRQWLRGSAGDYPLSGKPRKKALLIVGGVAAVVAAVALLTFFLMNPPVRSRAVARPGVTTRIGVDGIVATIPGNAVASPVEIAVEVTEPTPGMTEDVRLETPLFTFTEPGGAFQAPITVDIDSERISPEAGRVLFPAYWDGERWVQVFAEREGGVFQVTTDHLSSWAIVSAAQISHPIMLLLPTVTEALFGYGEVSWQSVQSDASTIRANSQRYFSNGVPQVGMLEATGASVASIRIRGGEYTLVPTNVPAHQGRGYPGMSTQPGIQDSRGEWVLDPSLQFDVLYAYWSRQFLNDSDIDALADEFQRAADQLQSVYLWHGAAGGLDALQMILTEILVTGTTGISPSAVSIIENSVTALEGMICRAEMFRFRLKLEGIAASLRSYRSGGMSDEEAAALVMGMEDAYNRIEPLAELSRSTFPAYEENWFSYTAERVFSSFFGHILGAVLRQGASVAARTSTMDPVHVQMAMEVLAALPDAYKTFGLAQVVAHVTNMGGDNPLFDYYGSTRYFNTNFIHTFDIARDLVYMELAAGTSPGVIRIGSTPSNATVYFNGTNTGMVTPAELQDFQPGTHHVRLYLDGYNEFNESFTVAEGRGHSIQAVMELPTPPLPVFDLDLSNGASFTNNVITVSGTIRLRDAAGNITPFLGSSAILTLNGVDQAVSVSSGRFSLEISIPSGESTIIMRANSHAGDTGVSSEITVHGNFTVPDLEVTLTWNTPTSDMDLHVWNPRGEHSFYSSKNTSEGFLDIDDVDGWGPETFTAENAYSGTYTIRINSFSLDQDNYSDVTVTVYVRGQHLGTYGPHRFTVQDANGTNPAAWWEVTTVNMQ